MKRFIIGVCALPLLLVAAAAHGASSNPSPPAELKKLDAWVGTWSLSGTARDQPNEREYSVLWRLHEHWVLNGFFLQVEQSYGFWIRKRRINLVTDRKLQWQNHDREGRDEGPGRGNGKVPHDSTMRQERGAMAGLESTRNKIEMMFVSPNARP